MGHHFESDLAKQYPQLDLTDLYAFQSERANYTAFIMCQNPRTFQKQDVGLMPGGLYNLHVAYARDSSTGITITFKVADDSSFISVGLAKTALTDFGVLGKVLGKVVDGNLLTTEGIRLWTGTAKDPFFGNAKGLQAFKEAAANNLYKPDSFDNAENSFENLLTTAIVIELPNDWFPETVFYSGTSAWFDRGHWHQVNRIGHVLLPHLYLKHGQQVESQMTSSSSTDIDRRTLVASVVSKYARLAEAQADYEAYGYQVAELVLPDVVPYKIGTKALYHAQNLNGRWLEDNSMDVALELLVGKPLPCQALMAQRSQPNFPYVIPVD